MEEDEEVQHSGCSGYRGLVFQASTVDLGSPQRIDVRHYGHRCVCDVRIHSDPAPGLLHRIDWSVSEVPVLKLRAVVSIHQEGSVNRFDGSGVKAQRVVRFVVELDYDEVELVCQALWAFGGSEAKDLKASLRSAQEGDAE